MVALTVHVVGVIGRDDESPSFVTHFGGLDEETLNTEVSFFRRLPRVPGVVFV